MLKRTSEQLTSVKVVKKRQLEGFFGDRFRDIQLLSNSKDIDNLLTMLNDSSKSKGISVLHYKNYISNYIYSCGYYKGLIIYNKNGAIVQQKGENDSTFSASFYNVDGAQYKMLKSSFAKINGPSIIDYNPNDKGEDLCLKVAAPIILKNETIGYIALEIPLKAINRIMYENSKESGFGESGESYLVGYDYLMRSNSRFKKNSVLKTFVNTESARNALNNKEGTIITNDYRNVKVLSSFSKVSINGLNWCILAEFDFDETMVPIKNTQNEILFISILITLFVFIIAYLIAKRISKPIILLRNAAIEIGKGEFKTVPESLANVEISQLTESFNFMSEQLKDKHEQLEIEKKKRLTAAIDGQEKERQRLSRELHDGLGQSLVALKFQIESIADNTTDNKESLNKLDIELGSIVEDVRRLSYNLMPAALSEFGLEKALQNLAKQLTDISEVTVTFDTMDNQIFVNQRASVYLFRIAQEAINNAVKYAAASIIIVNLMETKGNIVMMIEDDGKGFEIDNTIMGNGIINMKERTQLLGGLFDIESTIGVGTIVNVRIPKTYAKD